MDAMSESKTMQVSPAKLLRRVADLGFSCMKHYFTARQFPPKGLSLCFDTRKGRYVRVTESFESGRLVLQDEAVLIVPCVGIRIFCGVCRRVHDPSYDPKAPNDDALHMCAVSNALWHPFLRVLRVLPLIHRKTGVPLTRLKLLLYWLLKYYWGMRVWTQGCSASVHQDPSACSQVGSWRIPRHLTPLLAIFGMHFAGSSATSPHTRNTRVVQVTDGASLQGDMMLQTDCQLRHADQLLAAVRLLVQLLPSETAAFLPGGTHGGAWWSVGGDGTTKWTAEHTVVIAMRLVVCMNANGFTVMPVAYDDRHEVRVHADQSSWEARRGVSRRTLSTTRRIHILPSPPPTVAHSFALDPCAAVFLSVAMFEHSCAPSLRFICNVRRKRPLHGLTTTSDSTTVSETAGSATETSSDSTSLSPRSLNDCLLQMWVPALSRAGDSHEGTAVRTDGMHDLLLCDRMFLSLATTCNVPQGSALALSYLPQPYTCTLSRQANLRYHEFVCGCVQCAAPVDMARAFVCPACQVGCVYGSSRSRGASHQQDGGMAWVCVNPACRRRLSPSQIRECVLAEMSLAGFSQWDPHRFSSLAGAVPWGMQPAPQGVEPDRVRRLRALVRLHALLLSRGLSPQKSDKSLETRLSDVRECGVPAPVLVSMMGRVHVSHHLWLQALMELLDSKNHAGILSYIALYTPVFLVNALLTIVMSMVRLFSLPLSVDTPHSHSSSSAGHQQPTVGCITGAWTPAQRSGECIGAKFLALLPTTGNEDRRVTFDARAVKLAYRVMLSSHDPRILEQCVHLPYFLEVFGCHGAGVGVECTQEGKCGGSSDGSVERDDVAAHNTAGDDSTVRRAEDKHHRDTVSRKFGAVGLWSCGEPVQSDRSGVLSAFGTLRVVGDRVMRGRDDMMVTCRCDHIPGESSGNARKPLKQGAGESKSRKLVTAVGAGESMECPTGHIHWAIPANTSLFNFYLQLGHFCRALGCPESRDQPLSHQVSASKRKSRKKKKHSPPSGSLDLLRWAQTMYYAAYRVSLLLHGDSVVGYGDTVSGGGKVRSMTEVPLMTTVTQPSVHGVFTVECVRMWHDVTSRIEQMDGMDRR